MVHRDAVAGLEAAHGEVVDADGAHAARRQPLARRGGDVTKSSTNPPAFRRAASCGF